MSTIEKFDDNVMHTYGRFGVVLDKGEKRTCIDEIVHRFRKRYRMQFSRFLR